jgi:signal transduction histidine kinase/ligand-binding sensor domain-containing protein
MLKSTATPGNGNLFETESPQQSTVWMGVYLLALAALLFANVPARALDPTRALTQYGHSAWRIQDGIVAGAVTSLAQTSDGYLWIGTRAGLLRFNGADLVPFEPPGGEPIRSPRILALLGARDGSLWIGTGSDLERWSAGRLTHYPGEVGYNLSFVLDIKQARDGRIWIARSRVPAGEGPVCRVDRAKLECFGLKEGIALPYVMDLLEDERGDLWIHSDDEVVRWSPKSLRAETMQVINGGTDGIQALAFDGNGGVLIGSAVAAGGYGLSLLQGKHLQPFQLSTFDGRSIAVQTLFIDSNRSLWVGTQGEGIFRITGQRVDRYRATDGLSSDAINKIMEDREGNIWVATQQGVDRFRDIKVPTFSAHEGLSADQVNAVVASRDGSIWISNFHALDIMRGKTVSSFRGGQNLPGEQVTSLFEDRLGRMWIGIDQRLTRFDHGEFRPVRSAEGTETGPIAAIMDDPAGNLWVISQKGPNGSVLRIVGDVVQQEIPFEQLPIAKAGAIASDVHNGVWLPMVNGDIAHWHDGQADIIALHRASHTGFVIGIISTPDGAVYTNSTLGVVGIRGGRWQTLDASNGLPCKSVRTMLWDEKQLWLYADCGLLSVTHAQLEKWWRDPKAKVEVRTFDSFDGVQPAASSWYPKSSRSPDGRLWFANASVLQMMDPAHIGQNRLAPLVQIEKVVADRVTFPGAGGLRLLPLTQNVEVDYTASSYAIPQRVRFRYKLEGYDKEWQEAGNRRQAFYTSLPPGQYRFRVIACNNDGVWNTVGALLPLEVMPAFYQTGWFVALCVVAIVGIMWLLYLARIRQVTAHIRMRLEARVKEREQIARDLHDTLLQGVQGLLYQFQAAAERLSRTEPVRVVMEEALERADSLIAQGRERVTGLRGGSAPGASLEEALLAVATDLAKGSGRILHSSVQGTPRPVHPIAREELLRIGSEALINAFTHGMAADIEIEVVYHQTSLLLRIRDNGRGFDVDAWSAGQRGGHFGLLGMEERAQRLNARAQIWSRTGAGTEVSVRVDAGTAYVQPRPTGIRGWLGRMLGAVRMSR